jgi:uncharacterized metal-binding protein YceD (DUF177 family)
MTDKISDTPRGAEPLPFSHPIEVDKLPEGGLDLELSAGESEREALAEADGIPQIGRFDVAFHVMRRAGGRVNVSGELRARVTRICVVSLEPFEVDVIEPIDVDFAPETPISAVHSAEDGDLDDPPDPIIDGKIDLGALASEFLVLGLDPHPRKPGVSFAPVEQAGSDETASPFALLHKLQDLKKKG